MHVFVFIETEASIAKPSALDAIRYAQALGEEVSALVIGVPGEDEVKKIGTGAHNR